MIWEIEYKSLWLAVFNLYIKSRARFRFNQSALRVEVTISRGHASNLSWRFCHFWEPWCVSMDCHCQPQLLVGCMSYRCLKCACWCWHYECTNLKCDDICRNTSFIRYIQDKSLWFASHNFHIESPARALFNRWTFRVANTMMRVKWVRTSLPLPKAETHLYGLWFPTLSY